MQYREDIVVDEEMRVIQCPKCENEVFSEEAVHCRICGTRLFNQCDGEQECDNYGNPTDYIHYHNNPGNARYCETCGEPTYFLREGFLKPWEEEQKEIKELIDLGIVDADNDAEAAVSDENDYSDVPF